MSLVAAVTSIAERFSMPDWLARAGIAFLVRRTSRRLDRLSLADHDAFARSMAMFPIAEYVDDANAQHYEVPASFFNLALGPRRKYSSCLYQNPDDTLAIAEERALAETTAHADLQDGQAILELGCGWGSLTLWMAERFPLSRIKAVSNSKSQRMFIEAEAAERGFKNIDVITADMNTFIPTESFDRVVSVEMFEHMANWRSLLERVRSWLHADGRLFLHVFTHRGQSYRFDRRDKADWIAQHFFTGGLMPSRRLIRSFPDIFEVEYEWRWNGSHYHRTAEEWLRNFDSHVDKIRLILRDVYGKDADLWMRRWRLFFLATAGLFEHGNGEVWGVSHYRLRPNL